MNLNYTSKSLFTLLLTVSFFTNFFTYPMQTPDSTTKPTVTQLKVLNQEGAECGYHALYNGITIAKALKDSTLLSLLENNRDRETLFGSNNSSWKKRVISIRARTLAKYYLADKLLNMVKDTKTEFRPSDGSYQLNLSSGYIKLAPFTSGFFNFNYSEDQRKIVCDIITNVAEYLANTQIICQTNKFAYNITPEDIIDAFSQELNRRYDESGRSVYNFLNSRDNILAYLSKIEAVNFEICYDYEIRDTKTNKTVFVMDWYNKNKKESSQFQKFSQVAQWLSSEEIETIIRFEKDNGTEIPNNLQIFCLEENNIQEQFNINSELQELAINFRNINYSGTAVFLIYYPGHWITCVVAKNKNQTPEFIIADSLNIDRTKSTQALELINILTNIHNSAPSSGSTDNSESSEPTDSTSSSNSEETSSSNTFKISEDLALPIELLLEGKDLLEARVTAAQLRNNDNPERGLLLYGPPSTGKFSIAYAISKLAECELVALEAMSLSLDQTDQNPDSQNKTNLDEKTLDILFDKIKNISPVVLFIHRIDNLVKNNSSAESKKLLIAQLVNKLKQFRRENLILFIFSSYISPEELTKGNNIYELFNSIKVDLPNYNKREVIIKHYLKLYGVRVFSELKKLGKSKDEEFFWMDGETFWILCTVSNGFSGSDIKEFAKKALLAIKDGIKNTDIPSNWYRYKNEFDFKNRPGISILLTISTPCYFLFSKVSDYSEYGNCILTFCKMQQEQKQNQKALQDAVLVDKFDNSELWDVVIGLGLKGVKELAIIVSKLGGAVIAGLAKGAENTAEDFVNKKWEDYKEKNGWNKPS